MVRTLTIAYTELLVKLYFHVYRIRGIVNYVIYVVVSLLGLLWNIMHYTSIEHYDCSSFLYLLYILTSVFTAYLF